MMFAVPTVFFRPDALAGHHVNHPAGNVGTDIAILWKNKSTGGKRATTVRGLDSWHNIYSLHFGANLPDGAILVCARVLKDLLTIVSVDELPAQEHRSTST